MRSVECQFLYLNFLTSVHSLPSLKMTWYVCMLCPDTARLRGPSSIKLQMYISFDIIRNLKFILYQLGSRKYAERKECWRPKTRLENYSINGYMIAPGGQYLLTVYYLHHMVFADAD